MTLLNTMHSEEIPEVTVAVAVAVGEDFTMICYVQGYV